MEKVELSKELMENIQAGNVDGVLFDRNGHRLVVDRAVSYNVHPEYVAKRHIVELERAIRHGRFTYMGKEYIVNDLVK